MCVSQISGTLTAGSFVAPSSTSSLGHWSVLPAHPPTHCATPSVQGERLIYSGPATAAEAQMRQEIAYERGRADAFKTILDQILRPSTTLACRGVIVGETAETATAPEDATESIPQCTPEISAALRDAEAALQEACEEIERVHVRGERY